MILTAIANERPIETFDRYAAHERLVRTMVRGRPGVYLNVSSERREWFYLGESENVNNRNDGHINGDFFLVRVYVTGSKSDAKCLQDSLYKQLTDLDKVSRVVRLKRKPDRPLGMCGAIRLENGVNPVELFDGLVDKFYKEWCRAKAGVIR
jgi:hypothetical protein